jgi:hypothetical protein
LNFSEFISISSLEFLGYDKLIQAVLNYSQNKSKSLNTSMQDAKEKINILINNDIDLYQLCNGHDLVSLISLALRRKISNKNSNACSEEQIQRELMLAYDSRHFERTKLYNQIKAWEEVRKKIILRF